MEENKISKKVFFRCDYCKRAVWKGEKCYRDGKIKCCDKEDCKFKHNLVKLKE